MYICPRCKKKQKSIGVESICTQIYYGKDIGYNDLEIETTTSYFCPECGHKLPKGYDEESVDICMMQ